MLAPALVVTACVASGFALSSCGQDVSSEPLEIDGIWMSRADIARLPTEGAAWNQLLTAARQPTHRPDLSDQKDPTNVYVMAKKGDASVAGVMQQPLEQAQMGIPPMWNSYVTVDDIEATTARVEAAGGSVMVPPMDAMDAGRMSVVVDPTGAVICMWQPNQHIGAELVNEAGALAWNELITPDVPSAAAFYRDVFGWKNETIDMGEGNMYTVFKVDGDEIAGAMPPPMDGMPPNWGVYFAVDDCDGCVAHATELGGSVVAAPMDTPPGRIAVLSDPTGAVFSIMQLAEPAA